MSASDANVSGYVQRIFEEAYGESENAKKAVHTEMLWRRGLAYGLKAIPVFGGIAITAGVSGQIAQIIGVAVMVAVAIDAFFLNHARLITVSKADKAFKRLLRDVRNAHQLALGPILDLKNAADQRWTPSVRPRSAENKIDSRSLLSFVFLFVRRSFCASKTF